jgi:hypothetical protein
MKAFEDARESFNEYQKNGGFHNLEDSLGLLNEIIESKGIDLQRAINFKQIIGRHIDVQINEIWVKSNVDDFGKALNDDELGNLLWESLSKDVFVNFVRLSRIKKNYFE